VKGPAETLYIVEQGTDRNLDNILVLAGEGARMRGGFLSALAERPDSALVLRNARTGLIVASALEGAFSSRARRRGLLGRTGLPEGAAMVIAPTNSIHTFFMKFPIDVLFVRRDGRVTKVRSRVPPGRLVVSPTAFAVIETAAGGGAGVAAGDYLELAKQSV
jgi:uncharacterized membrane protein (UPF0127 family)